VLENPMRALPLCLSSSLAIVGGLGDVKVIPNNPIDNGICHLDRFLVENPMIGVFNFDAL